jgi:O-glycosyl hydrolase
VATAGNPPSGVAVTAYINPSNNALVIVAINNNTSSTQLPLYLGSSAPCTLVPWETSASKSLVQGSGVTVSNARVTVTLTGQSVTTFVGMP